MLSWPQGISVALYAVVGAMSAWVGLLHATRRVEGRGPRRAARLFAVFWLALALDAAIGAGLVLLAGVGTGSEGLAALFTILTFPTIGAMMCGLLFYLVYLFSGREGALWPLVAFYAAASVGSVVLLLGLGPTGFSATRWGAQIAYTHTPSAGTSAFLGLVFLLPSILGAVAYGSFFFRTSGATQRYRIALVALGILVWFVTSLVLTVPAFVASDGVQGGGRALTLSSILAVVAAYAPPAWVQRRFRIEPLVHEIPMIPRWSAEERSSRDEALIERVRELI
jgi:hypothetical protein